MTGARITLLRSQENALRHYLDGHPDGHERACVLLMRRLERNVAGLGTSDRYVLIEFHPFQDEWITSSSATHLGFRLKYLRELFRRCEEEQLTFCFVHSHPTGAVLFSELDEANERTLLQALTNRNGKKIHFVAMLWSTGTWAARIRTSEFPDQVEAVRHILVVGDSIQLHGYRREQCTTREEFARQTAAFGAAFVDQLQTLRVGVVGGGGTGSPTVTLLARSGVGEIVVIDNDKLEKSNLNRVRGAGALDIGKNKASLLREFVSNLRLPTKIVSVEHLVDTSPAAIDAIASCDIIFGCTDDQIGRELLNACVYVYAIPLIDVGLGGQLGKDSDGNPYLQYHFGRVSTILPESGECLFCQGVIRPDWIQYQYALRENPEMNEAVAKERYLQAGGETAPGVGPFTSAVADFGVATLIDLVTRFRKFPPELRKDIFKIDFVKMELRSSEEKHDSDCVYCKAHDFLLVRERCRLNRPLLGKPNVAL